MERQLRPKRPVRRTPSEAPKIASEGSAWVRRYLIDLYDRRDGEAANWQLIAETAFKVGLDAIDLAPHARRRDQMLNRLHEATYDRLAGAIAPLSFGTHALGAPTAPQLKGPHLEGEPRRPDTRP